MSYTRPDYNAVNFTWEGETAYERFNFNAVSLEWRASGLYVRPVPGAADVSWEYASAYTRLAYDVADASFAESAVETLTGSGTFDPIITEITGDGQLLFSSGTFDPIITEITGDGRLLFSSGTFDPIITEITGEGDVKVISQYVKLKTFYIIGTVGLSVFKTLKGSGLFSPIVSDITGFGSKVYSAGKMEAPLTFIGYGTSTIHGSGEFIFSSVIKGYGTSSGGLPGDDPDVECDLSANCPTVEGFSYSPDAGLVRSEMQDGVVRQRRKWTNARIALNLRFKLSKKCLIEMEKFIESVGGDWWTIYLITGKSGSTPKLHTVRLIDNPRINRMSGGQVFEYLITVETDGKVYN